MKSERHALRAVAVVSVALLALTACGSDDSSGGSSQSASESVTASNSTSASPSGDVPQGDGKLVLGALLPQTGDLVAEGPPEFAGMAVAVDDINAAGGVLGQPVTEVLADSGDGTPDIASAQTDKLLDAGSDVIVGASASSVSLSVIDKITGAGVVQFSPANTSPAFDTYDDGGLYFRTAPSDILQGEVLANLVVEDGASNVAILARQDSYGEGLADQVEKVVQEKGAKVAAKVLYSADATNFSAEVNKIAASKPDALVLISFDETKKILPQLIAKTVGPQDIKTYFVDGNTVNYGDEFPPGTLEGVKATYPAPPELDPSFKEKLLAKDPKLKGFTYAPQAYDTVVISALAAEAAGSDNSGAIASEIVDVSREGTKCSTFEDCLALIKQGEDIDYEGLSGPCDMNDSGSPSKATIGIQLFDGKNNYSQIDAVTGVLN
ncbi:MAG TPA: ABC transporter substrate-binding protein [Actinomycetes bacterium]|nr:ABC transporter substrate-binding protein [Actinomycetes bacterium]